jgi:hypothetical protein
MNKIQIESALYNSQSKMHETSAMTYRWLLSHMKAKDTDPDVFTGGISSSLTKLFAVVNEELIYQYPAL